MGDDPRATYAAAGVSIAAGDALVEAIKPLARSTLRPGADPSLGGFGALFDLGAAGHAGSLLVASTDGVGTKLRLAIELGRHEGVGIDLVAMCVNDVLAQGAEPLFFLDYFAAGRLDVERARQVVEGIAAGCREAGCALIGGETAEMPGHYHGEDYDLAGFVVGAVPRDRLLPRNVRAGDALLALPSSGAHSNGYSLIRRLIADGALDLAARCGEASLAEALIAPTRIYVRPVLKALAAHPDAIHAIAHITGGGLTGNVPRVLPEARGARIDRGALPPNAVMDALRHAGRFDDATMEATFNCGVGLVLVVASASLDAISATLEAAGERPVVIGEVVAAEGSERRCEIA